MAIVVQIGFFFIRIAQKAYYRQEGSYYANRKRPIENAKKTFVLDHAVDWTGERSKEIAIVTEISANTVNYAADEMINVCSTEEPLGYSWYEAVTEIATAKKNPFLSVKHEHLLICITWFGNSNTTATWYDLGGMGT